MADMIRLTDTKLLDLYQSAQTELRRRTAKECGRLDDATLIRGNEMGKRALIVAAAGKHSICFVGPPESGKTMFRALALNFDVEAFEHRPCPCGYRNDLRQDCTCTVAKIERYAAKWPHTDLLVEIMPPPEKEMRSTGTSLAEMQAVVAQAASYTSLDLDADNANLLKACVSELNIRADGRQRILAVARTIANLDRSERIGTLHLSEAINYQQPYYKRAF